MSGEREMRAIQSVFPDLCRDPLIGDGRGEHFLGKKKLDNQRFYIYCKDFKPPGWDHPLRRFSILYWTNEDTNPSVDNDASPPYPPTQWVVEMWLMTQHDSYTVEWGGVATEDFKNEQGFLQYVTKGSDNLPIPQDGEEMFKLQTPEGSLFFPKKITPLSRDDIPSEITHLTVTELPWA
jgi:hypothetical protein